MRDFEGNLLIGGQTLKHLHVELLGDDRNGDSDEWLLTGRLTLDSNEQQQLQVGRRYRLQLPDGRAGQVIIASMNRYGHSIVAEFHPQRAPVAVG